MSYAQSLENPELIDQIVQNVIEDILNANNMKKIEPVGIDPGVEAKTYMSTKEIYEIFKVI